MQGTKPHLYSRYDHFTARPRKVMTSLRLLSYNIQVGIQTNSPHHYLTKGWQHLLPHFKQANNLDLIAETIREFDIVALQEVDGGSLRTRYINQVEYLAEQAIFPYWHSQCNRNLGHFAQHSNGMLSRLYPNKIENIKLPGMIPGRGAIMIEFGNERNPLLFLMVHLALGGRSHRMQLDCLNEICQQYQHIIIMGDMNCNYGTLEQSDLLSTRNLRSANTELNTYPSWRPTRNIDHILLSAELGIKSCDVLSASYSDHLPLALEISLPSQLLLA